MDSFCPLMHHQIMVDFNGRASPCCQFGRDAAYADYESIMIPLRQDMESGRRISECSRCWEDEDRGLRSLRQVSIEDYDRFGSVDGLVTLDLRITNLCNMACTMCSEHASTLWSRLRGEDRLSRLDQSILDDIRSRSSGIRRISVQGGEPFYGIDFVEFIDSLGNKDRISLEVFTNLITADPAILERWRNEFATISIIGSVDGTGKTYDAIRWPAKWNKLDRRAREAHALLGKSLKFNFTLQNINLLNIQDFISWRNDACPGSEITFSILHWPTALQFHVIDGDEKMRALDMLRNIRGALPGEAMQLHGLLRQLGTAQQCDPSLLDARRQYLEYVMTVRAGKYG